LSQGHTVARPQKAVRTWKCSNDEQNVCSFLNVTFDQNHLLQFIKHLATRILLSTEKDNNTLPSNKISGHRKCLRKSGIRQCWQETGYSTWKEHYRDRHIHSMRSVTDNWILCDKWSLSNNTCKITAAQISCSVSHNNGKRQQHCNIDIDVVFLCVWRGT
jgi:hypothetical protein